MKTLNDLVVKVCESENPIFEVKFCSDNGVCLLLGNTLEGQYAYRIKSMFSDKVLSSEETHNVDHLVNRMMAGLLETFNTNDYFDNEDRNSLFWNEPSHDRKWSREDIELWLLDNLSKYAGRRRPICLGSFR